jgi:hypothetical protein
MRKVRRRASPFRQLDRDMPLLVHVFARGARRPDPPDGEHAEPGRPRESPRHGQASPASGLGSGVCLGSLAALAKRLTLSQPSRDARHELTWPEITILDLLGVGLLCVAALRVAITRQ